MSNKQAVIFIALCILAMTVACTYVGVMIGLLMRAAS